MYKINDILAYNSKGIFAVGIITKITIMAEDMIIYGLTGIDCDVDILSENIVKMLGNAKDIKAEYEVGQDDC
jgi:hypothetical protein